MKLTLSRLAKIAAVCSVVLCSSVMAATGPTLITQSVQQKLTPNQMLQRLKQGNERFIRQKPLQIDYIKKAMLTAKGQYPGAVVLSCIDSRVPPEIVFDQAVGNIFVSRVAANVLNADVLGGMEFATQLAGAKLIVVMGHDSCGAVRGACQDAKLGHLTQLLDKVQPAIKEAKQQLGKVNCNSERFIDQAAKDNVEHVVNQIYQKSPVIRKLVEQGKVKIIGAMYHLKTGKVTFFDER